MEKALILRILSKKDAVDLDDSLYNLRYITEDLRHIIIMSLIPNEDFIISTKQRLNSIYNLLIPIVNNIDNSDYIQGYTNSKKHLSKYISNICININNLKESMDPLDMKLLIYNTNMLTDLVLSY